MTMIFLVMLSWISSSVPCALIIKLESRNSPLIEVTGCIQLLFPVKFHLYNNDTPTASEIVPHQQETCSYLTLANLTR